MKRKNNVRKSCDKISYLIELLPEDRLINSIRERIERELLRIKRTTWRGDSAKVSIYKQSTTTMGAKLNVEQIPYY